MELAQGNSLHHQPSESGDAVVHLSRLIRENSLIHKIKDLKTGQKHVARGPVEGIATALQRDRMLDSRDGDVSTKSLSDEKRLEKSVFIPCISRMVTDHNLECALCGLKGGRKKDLGDLLLFRQGSNALDDTDLEICMHENCAHWSVKDLMEDKIRWRNKVLMPALCYLYHA
jgi:hypothetical protein